MAHSVLLQDWIHLEGTNELTQDESDWIDLAGFTDIILYTTTTAFTGTSLAIGLQTSPCKDEALFADMASLTSGGSRIKSIILFSSASEPLARWVRWKVTATGGFTVGFRIWAAVNATGR